MREGAPPAARVVGARRACRERQGFDAETDGLFSFFTFSFIAAASCGGYIGAARRRFDVDALSLAAAPSTAFWARSPWRRPSASVRLNRNWIALGFRAFFQVLPTFLRRRREALPASMRPRCGEGNFNAALNRCTCPIGRNGTRCEQDALPACRTSASAAAASASLASNALSSALLECIGECAFSHQIHRYCFVTLMEKDLWGSLIKASREHSEIPAEDERAEEEEVDGRRFGRLSPHSRPPAWPRASRIKR